MQAPKESLAGVIAANKERQRMARELNIRAGGAVFPVLSQSDMMSFVTRQLRGARNIGEIPYLDDLRLAPLDSEVVAQVMRDNPDQVDVGGQGSLPVTYQQGYAPRVDIAERWIDVPDEGVKLPGGREVAFRFAAGGYWRGPNTEVRKLKAECAEYEAQTAFSRFPPPVLEVPDLEDAVVPEIREDQYGTHALTGAALVAFGTLTFNSWHSRFEWKWFSRREDAEAQHRVVCEWVESLRMEAQRKREAQEEQIRAEQARQEAEANRLAEEDRQRLKAEEAERLAAEAERVREAATRNKPVTLTAGALSGLFGGAAKVEPAKKKR